MKRWKTPALIATIALIGCGFLIWALMPPSIEVDLGMVTRGPLRETVDDDGKTRIRDRFVVSAPLSGRLQRIVLRPGERVAASVTPLAVIEPKDPDLLDAAARAQAEARVKSADAARKQASAQVERARADHKLALRELERIRAVFGQQGASQQELDAAEARERQALETVRSAQFAGQVADFEAEQARAALVRTRPRSPGEPDDMRFEILAPVDGRVLRVFQESATYVSPGTQLLELGNTSDLELVVDVLSTDAVRIVPGARIVLERWGGPDPLTAKVRLVEPYAFTKISALGVEEQRVNVVADLEGPPSHYARMGDGYRVEARIIVWESESVLKAPAAALFRHMDKWAVFRVQRGRAALQPVRIGHSNGIETEILEGIAEGDQVVLHPSDTVRDGVSIKARP